MKTKRILLTLVTLLLVIGLAACERPVPRPQNAEASATPEGNFPVPGVTDDVMGQLESFATQTAIAMQGGGVTSDAPAVATPTPGQDAVVTPEATSEPSVATPQVESPTTAPVAVTVPTATPGIPKSYTLQKGEHPFCIARRFNVNPDEMLRLSNLGRNDSYSPGTVLKIPQSGNPFPANRSLRNHPTTYTVGSGETIYSIACLFGDADPNAIAAANGLSSPYKISAGQTLNIP